MKSKISVVIAAYRGEKYLGEQLESLLRQTRLPDEIVICDDSPSFETKNVVDAFALRASFPVIYEHNPKPLGPAQNFAAGMRKASGDLIFLCDQDDVWLPEKIEKLAAELETHPECDVVFCNSAVTGPDLRKLGFSIADIVHFTKKHADELNAGRGIRDLLRTPMLYGHNIAMRRRFLKIALPIPDLPSHDLWIAELCAGTGRVRCIYEDLTLHRRHGDNQSTQDIPAGFVRRIRALLTKHKKKCDTELYDSFRHADEAYLRLKNMSGAAPAENLEMLRESAEYYRKRLALSKKSRLLRPFFIFGVRGYFKCGWGWRSILRDLVF